MLCNDLNPPEGTSLCVKLKWQTCTFFLIFPSFLIVFTLAITEFVRATLSWIMSWESKCVSRGNIGHSIGQNWS